MADFSNNPFSSQRPMKPLGGYGQQFRSAPTQGSGMGGGMGGGRFSNPGNGGRFSGTPQMPNMGQMRMGNGRPDLPQTGGGGASMYNVPQAQDPGFSMQPPPQIEQPPLPQYSQGWAQQQPPGFLGNNSGMDLSQIQNLPYGFPRRY